MTKYGVANAAELDANGNPKVDWYDDPQIAQALCKKEQARGKSVYLVKMTEVGYYPAKVFNPC